VPAGLLASPSCLGLAARTADPGQEWHSGLLTVHIRHLNIWFPRCEAPLALHQMKAWDALRTGGLAYSSSAYSGSGGLGLLLCVVAGGVAVPGGACVGVLAFGGCVVEAEGFGDDGGGCLEDELAERGDPRGAHGEAEAA
jgi:hypothetical protein